MGQSCQNGKLESVKRAIQMNMFISKNTWSTRHRSFLDFVPTMVLISISLNTRGRRCRPWNHVGMTWHANTCVVYRCMYRYCEKDFKPDKCKAGKLQFNSGRVARFWRNKTEGLQRVTGVGINRVVTPCFKSRLQSAIFARIFPLLLQPKNCEIKFPAPSLG